MPFNSFSFFIFLIVILFCANLLHRYGSIQKFVLLVSCYYFYGQWGWPYCALIFTTTTVDFIVARKIFRGYRPRFMLASSFVVQLGILFTFKYFNFFVNTTNELWRFWGCSGHINPLPILLPIGISFYTFKSLSYVVDVYRGDIEPRRSFLDYALYVSFFAHLAAGPIARAKNFFEQLQARTKPSFFDVQQAMGFILFGLVKKMAIADKLATMANPVFDSPATMDPYATLIGVYAFTFQIYFDFSGYSDIAIGVSKLFGINLPKNFDSPYLSTSFQEFWRRWHISLSTWLRDYLYIGIGGSRAGKWQTAWNTMVTMLLGGLWHGASWNFVLWGGLHGSYIIIERWLKSLWPAFWNSRSHASLLIRFLVTFNVVAFTWIFFRSPSLDNTIQILHNLAGALRLDPGQSPTAIIPYVFLFLALLYLHWFSNRLNWQERLKSLPGPTIVAAYSVALILLVIFHADISAPFIYFKF
ncbi:MAG: MBOAT family O-acyltransferase [Syntrophobacter sp.]